MKAPFSFAGRFSRRDYWLTFLALMAIGVAFGVGAALFLVLAGALSFSKTLVLLWLGLCFVSFSVATTWVSLAALAKRAHDVGHSGWWAALSFVPLVGLFVWLYLGLAAGAPNANRWGAAPGAIPIVAA